ncbi:MAG: YicC family protein [Oscillospiraceae bacterium]|nr:YicC family protein [Oscillospiraceae bacterium]
MVRSMTGFGRGEATVDGRDILVEIKSVNHRYFEFNCRTSRGYSFLEEKLKSYIKDSVKRGKVDVFVSLSQKEDTEAIVKINPSLAKGYINALRALADEYGVKDDISVSTVASYNDIFQIRKAPEDEEEVWSAVKPVLDTALANFIEMRKTEGAKLKEDIISRAEKILNIVSEIEERSPERVAEYQSRLQEKITELLGNADFDEQRVLTEVAIFADKVAVDEETVRLRSHFDQLKNLMDSENEIGRKIDFIIQEMNREANTIGSKANDSSLSHKVVDIKAEIEKIREQIQNIE